MTFKRVTSLFAVLAMSTAFVLAAVAGPAAAAVRHIDGTVVSKNAQTKTVQLSTQSGNVRIQVTSTTKFERISGFGALRKGLEVEVDAKQTSNGLVATQIETRSGSGGGNDDSAGDDHGGHGGGHDDGPNHT